jgi:nitrate reductase beta subunit
LTELCNEADCVMLPNHCVISCSHCSVTCKNACNNRSDIYFGGGGGEGHGT